MACKILFRAAALVTVGLTNASCAPKPASAQFTVFKSLCLATAAQPEAIRKAAAAQGFGDAPPGEAVHGLVKHDGAKTLSISYADRMLGGSGRMPAFSVRSCALLAGPGDPAAAADLAGWLHAAKPQPGRTTPYYVREDGARRTVIANGDKVALIAALTAKKLRLVQTAWPAPGTLLLFYGVAEPAPAALSSIP